MYYFGKRSRENLATADERLQRLFNEVIKHRDCSVTCGYRSLKEQQEMFETGRSRVRMGKHNVYPSYAVDVSPYPIDWGDIPRYYNFIDFVLSIAKDMKLSIRSGADWDMDGDRTDNKLLDCPHYEIWSPDMKVEFDKKKNEVVIIEPELVCEKEDDDKSVPLPKGFKRK